MRIAIRRLPWHLVWIVSAFEGMTVAILPYLATLQSDQPISKPPESGLLLGYIGMLTAILLANALGARRSIITAGTLKIHNPLYVSIWGAIFLALIFLFQSAFGFSTNHVLGISARAIFSLSASTVTVVVLYRLLVTWWPAFSIRFTVGALTNRVVRASIWPLVAFVSLYEAIALPIIETIRDFEQHRLVAGLVLGAASGAIATTVVVLIYNILSSRLPSLRLELVVEPDA